MSTGLKQSVREFEEFISRKYVTKSNLQYFFNQSPKYLQLRPTGCKNCCKPYRKKKKKLPCLKREALCFSFSGHENLIVIDTPDFAQGLD